MKTQSKSLWPDRVGRKRKKLTCTVCDTGVAFATTLVYLYQFTTPKSRLNFPHLKGKLCACVTTNWKINLVSCCCLLWLWSQERRLLLFLVVAIVRPLETSEAVTFLHLFVWVIEVRWRTCWDTVHSPGSSSLSCCLSLFSCPLPSSPILCVLLLYPVLLLTKYFCLYWMPFCSRARCSFRALSSIFRFSLLASLLRPFWSKILHK